MATEDRIERARLLYEDAVFGGRPDALTEADRELDAVAADLALARGRVAHARFLATRAEQAGQRESLDRAAQLYAALGDRRGEAEALFWLGTYHQVVTGDHDTAVPLLQRSRRLATSAGDPLTCSYALRHLGIAAHAAGRTGEARSLLEESTRLRREVGFRPGVAANLVGLAHLAVDEGRPADAAALAAEAAEIAEATGSRGLLPWIDEVDARL